jgi:gamma-glutamylcyclotransferase (GGCT)/AIG2-like uncharacterized protein YtfP
LTSPGGNTLAPAVHLFAYGTLVEPHTLDHVLGHRHLGERLAARLEGYRRTTADGYAYAFLVAEPGQSVDGVLIMDLTSTDLQALDAYEDVDTLAYRRETVEVDALGCGPRGLRVQAQTYVGGPALLAMLRR